MLDYRLLAIGVNSTPGADTLDFAESDASAFHRTMRSGIGPVGDAQSELFLGRAATLCSVRIALRRISWVRPRFFCFYAAGHGSALGIHLANGVLSWAELRQAIAQIGAESSMVVLDTCDAGQFLSFFSESEGMAGLDADWLTLLANATPGTRVLAAARAGENSHEWPGARGGLFTRSLLRVLRTANGDLRGSSGRLWVSDELAFNEVLKHMSSLEDVSQVPVARRLTGRFPLSLGQASPVGTARLSTEVTRDSLLVECSVEGRRFLPTYLRYTVLNSDGLDLVSERMRLVPPYDATRTQRRLELPVSSLESDYATQAWMRQCGEAEIQWFVELLDERDRQLTARVAPVSYGRPRWRRAVVY